MNSSNEAADQGPQEGPRRTGRAAATGPAAARLHGMLAPIDRLFDRIYGSAWNPLYQSGNLVVLFLGVAVVTGVYLFLFYQVGAPHESVARIENDIFLGSFVRSLHRYSADLALVALLVHLVRKLMQGHTWGPRALAWRSGIVLMFLVLLCGWTGLIMVWDLQGLRLAAKGAQMIDLLPLFSEPISRSFSGELGVPSSFFFMNLFLHVALPLGVVGGLWLHVARVARPALLPPRAMWRYTLGALALFSLAVPVALPAPADLMAIPTRTPIDVFYSFWLLPAEQISPAALVGLWLLLVGGLWSVPRWWRPRAAKIEPSFVDETRCTGCYNCYHDCPYEAISMVERTVPSSLSELVARVDSTECVSCGICSASCAPMGVGPAGRTGREQLAAARRFCQAVAPGKTDVVLLTCRYGLGSHSGLVDVGGVLPYETGCSGSVHTSVMEQMLRGGAGGVYVLTCPSRDCLNREGPKWVQQRMYAGREAELQERVDRRRVKLGSFAQSELALVERDLKEFVVEVQALESEPSGVAEVPQFECATTQEEVTTSG